MIVISGARGLSRGSLSECTLCMTDHFRRTEVLNGTIVRSKFGTSGSDVCWHRNNLGVRNPSLDESQSRPNCPDIPRISLPPSDSALFLIRRHVQTQTITEANKSLWQPRILSVSEKRIHPRESSFVKLVVSFSTGFISIQHPHSSYTLPPPFFRVAWRP